MTTAKQFFIAGTEGKLEAIYTPSDNKGDTNKPPVLLCHPHPLHGGTMHTKLVYWLGKIFQNQGHDTLKFNFRGVGCSEGKWGDGKGESDDAYVALQWLKEHKKSARPLWIAAFSFGCYAGLRAMLRERDVACVFAVAPAVNLYDFSFLQEDSRPVYVTHGTADDIVPYAAVDTWSLSMPQVQLTSIQGADHFFVQQKMALEAAILKQLQLGEHVP